MVVKLLFGKMLGLARIYPVIVGHSSDEAASLRALEGISRAWR